MNPTIQELKEEIEIALRLIAELCTKVDRLEKQVHKLTPKKDVKK